MSKQATILLDRVGDAEVPVGYSVVETEVDFLHVATEGRALVIRGPRLCDWARDFYRGRNISVRETTSPSREIQAAVPALTDGEAQELHSRIGPDSFRDLGRPLQPLYLLEALYPTRMWSDVPSRAHGAEWLLWLHTHQPDLVVQAVFAAILDDWRATAAEPERLLYEAADGATADELLRAWLYIEPQARFAALEEFPHAVSSSLIDVARRVWRRDILESYGAAFDAIERRPIPGELRRMAAQETAAHFLQNPEQLTYERYRKLARFLSSKQQEELTRFLPPKAPSALPATIEDVISWFEMEYLPFRLWQSRHGREQDAATAEAAARQFAMWYLEQYPKGVVGGPLHEHLIFNQTILSGPSEKVITLVIVLDGLHAEDARQLSLALEREARQLSLLEERWVFAVIPTVTLFAKDALLKGRDPGAARSKSFFARVLPERIDPSHQLAQAQPGEVLVWRIMEPDETYHGRNTFEMLRRMVEAALNRVALTIGDIVRNVADELPLQIIITTDHGRLLARASRTVSVPPGMQSHGRAAWGARQHTFDESGVLIDGEIAYLHGERFSLPEEAAEAAVLLDSSMFRTNDNRSGSEVYPHGGVSPEEVIVPWLVFRRDWEAPEVPITLSGRGVAGRKGESRIKAMNTDDAKLTIVQIDIQISEEDIRTHPLQLAINPRSIGEATIELDPWLTEAENATAKATATIRLPAGQQFNVPVTLDLATEEMYRRDNILEDLE